MKFRNPVTIAGASFALLILILDSKNALESAREGIELCLITLIPSLFPFFVVSILLTGALSGISIPMLRPAGNLCHIPVGSEYLLAIGLLGGYPVGAQNVAIAFRNGCLSREDAERMMGFCNNAGPAFLFGMIAPMFTQSRTAWIIWGIHLFTSFLVGMIIPPAEHTQVSACSPRPITFPEALEKAVKTMGLVCGWVIIFRIILMFLDRWIFCALPKEMSIIISGLLELSNGCIQLENIPCEGLRFVIAGVILSLGGACVSMQTASVCSGLSLRFYFPEKLLQCCMSLLLSAFLQFLFPKNQRWEFPLLFHISIVFCSIALSLYLHKNKKSCSIPAVLGV